MKILFVIDQYKAENNGVTVSARRYAKVLMEHGHTVRILSTADTGEDGYTVRELQVPIFGGLIHSQGMIFGVPEKDVIQKAVEWADFIHFLMPFPLSVRTAKIARSMGKPASAAFHVQPQNVSYSIRMGRRQGINRFIFRLFRTHFFDMFRHVHCPSQFIAKELEKNGYHSQLHVISNGIAPQFSYQRLPKPDAWQDRFVVLMIGRLSREKRQDVLIEAVRQSRHADQIQLVLAGQGPRRQALIQQAQGLAHPVAVDFYSQEDLRQLIAQADLYVHAADAEIEGMSCMEAFAEGLVPVVSDSPLSAVPQFALDERSLFRSGDSGDLAQKIDWWIEHPKEREEMSLRYADSAKKYALEHCVAQFEQMMRQAMEEGAWR